MVLGGCCTWWTLFRRSAGLCDQAHTHDQAGMHGCMTGQAQQQQKTAVRAVHLYICIVWWIS